MIPRDVWTVEAKDRSSIRERNFEENENGYGSYWDCMYSLLILFACVLYTSVLTLIPRHNSILYPDYWYEAMILFVGISVRNTALTVTELYIFTNAKDLLSKSVVLKLCFVIWLLFSIPYCVNYLFWTHYFGFHHPMPFIGAACGLFYDLMMLITFWLVVPKSLKNQENFRQQIKFYVLYRFWMIILIIQTNVLQTISRIISPSLQWILSVLIPTSVRGNSWVVSKIASKVPETNLEMLNNLVNTTIMIVFTVFITTRLSSLNDLTVYSILFVSFVIHLKGLYDILKFHNKTKIENRSLENHNLQSRQMERVEMLILSEFIDGISPLAFAIGFATAYYGYNATLIRNVRNDYFGGKIIQNVEHFYLVMFQMFSIDVIAMLLSAILLYFYGKINFFREFCIVMKKYWIILIVKLPVIAMHFGYNDINLGMDYTMNFLWLTDDGRLKLIQDDSDLSVQEKSMLINNTATYND